MIGEVQHRILRDAWPLQGKELSADFRHWPVISRCRRKQGSLRPSPLHNYRALDEHPPAASGLALKPLTTRVAHLFDRHHFQWNRECETQIAHSGGRGVNFHFLLLPSQR